MSSPQASHRRVTDLLQAAMLLLFICFADISQHAQVCYMVNGSRGHPFCSEHAWAAVHRLALHCTTRTLCDQTLTCSRRQELQTAVPRCEMMMMALPLQWVRKSAVIAKRARLMACKRNLVHFQSAPEPPAPWRQCWHVRS